MTPEETDRLVAEMDALPAYEGWRFSYEYPGYFCYSHPALPYNVFFTPDWQADQSLPIEVQGDDGQHFEEHSSTLPLPTEGRTGEKLLALVRPTLDKLAKLPRSPAEPTFELHVRLTQKEIDAIEKARDHVRVQMAHDHPWEVRDAALEGLDKIVAAAKEAEEAC